MTRRTRAERRWAAVSRQHDAMVRFTSGYRHWLPAPVSDFQARGEHPFCPGEHCADEPCEGEK